MHFLWATSPLVSGRRASLFVGRKTLSSSLGGVYRLRCRHNILGLLLLASRVAGVMQLSLPEVRSPVAMVESGRSSGVTLLAATGVCPTRDPLFASLVYMGRFLPERAISGKLKQLRRSPTMVLPDWLYRYRIQRAPIQSNSWCPLELSYLSSSSRIPFLALLLLRWNSEPKVSKPPGTWSLKANSCSLS